MSAIAQLGQRVGVEEDKITSPRVRSEAVGEVVSVQEAEDKQHTLRKEGTRQCLRVTPVDKLDICLSTAQWGLVKWVMPVASCSED